MINFHEKVLERPEYCRQFNCGNSLITVFNCPVDARLMQQRFAGIWTKYNYIFYVLEGRKVWHTTHGAFDFKAGDCVFVRKGGSILEQFVDQGFCLVLFFIPDDFLCDTLKSKARPLNHSDKKISPVIKLHTNELLNSFFISMFAYFRDTLEPDQSLLELKFKELILMLADNPMNAELLSYFCSLMRDPQSVSLERIMEDNFCYNLKLEQFAELCNRSLSAFKRDFKEHFEITPGKWLLEKRLQLAKSLIANSGKNVSEAAFESGFENTSHFSKAFKLRYGHSPNMSKSIKIES